MFVSPDASTIEITDNDCKIDAVHQLYSRSDAKLYFDVQM